MTNNIDIEHIVTAIKDISGNRRLVYIDYEPAFALYNSEIKKYAIKQSEPIEYNIYNEIIKNILPKRAIARAMNLLQTKDYTDNELRKKLKETYYPNDIIEIAMSYVISFDYINDRRYVENYISFKAGKKSKKQIILFLSNKGIKRQIIEDICDKFYSENENIELTYVIDQMRKKIVKFDNLGYEEQAKLMKYFYSKGFNTDIIKKALDIVINESYNTSFS